MKWSLFRSIIFPYSVNIFITNFWNLYLVNSLFILFLLLFFLELSLPLSFESSSSAFLFLLNILCLCQFRWNSYCGPEGVFFWGRTSIHINVSSAFGENLNLTWTSAAFPQRVTGSYHLDRGGTRYGGATACSLSAGYKNFLSDCGTSLYSVAKGGVWPQVADVEVLRASLVFALSP